MEYIAVKDCTLEITPALTLPEETGLTITTPPSTKVKAGGKSVYKGTITVSVPGGVASGYTYGSFTVNITGSAQKTKAEGSPVVLEGDSGNSTPQTGTQGTSKTTTTFTIKVKKAGQTKVKGT